RAHQIFAEKRIERLDQRAQMNRVLRIEPRVIIDRPVPIRRHCIVNHAAIVRRLAYDLPHIKRLPSFRVRYRSAESAETEFDARPRGFGQASLVGKRGRIAVDVIARWSAEQLMNRHAQRLPLDVPKRHIERAHRVQLLAPCWIKTSAQHQLPAVLNARGIFADQHLRALLHCVMRAAFADSRNPRVRLDSHDIETLIEHRARYRGMVEADTCDLHLRQRGMQSSSACAEESSLKERSTIHFSVDWLSTKYNIDPRHPRNRHGEDANRATGPLWRNRCAG